MSGAQNDPYEIPESEDDEIVMLRPTHLPDVRPAIKRRRNETVTISSDTDDGIDSATLQPLPKRARTTNHTSARVKGSTVHDVDATVTTSEEEDYERFNESYRNEDEFDLSLGEWPVPRVAMRIPKLRKSGETVLSSHLRRLGSSQEERELRLRPLTYARLSLLNCFPLVRSHKPPRQYLKRCRVGLFDTDVSFDYRPSLLKPLPELRLGGCPNTINQSHGFVVIAANVHGADSDDVSPANHNGLTVISSQSGARVPLSIAGHSRRVLAEEGDMQKEVTIYETVYDAQFDPAKPTRFMTAGHDDRAIIWNIEESPSGEQRVTSVRNGIPGNEHDKHMGSRPHFVRFSQDRSHWSAHDDVPSAFVLTDAKGKFHVEFPTGQGFVERVDGPRREIASIIWGKERSSNYVFAGTEASGFLPDINGGKQAAFLLHPSRKPVKHSYTDSTDEVENLAINPDGPLRVHRYDSSQAHNFSGDLLGSFTRNCDTSHVLCKNCDRRGINSQHKLSIYPVSEMSNRTTRRGQTNAIAEVNLPEFTKFSSSDRANDAGLVVSAAWSPCGKYIAAARDDDIVDIFDSRFLGPLPLMRLRHNTPPLVEMYRPACTLDGSFSDCERCVVVDKHPKHGITGLQWVQGTGYFGGEGLMSAGSDGCVRLWDVRQENISEVLVQLQTSAACISIGNISRSEISLIAADEDGLVKMLTASVS